MAQVLIYILVVCLALGCFAWANDALASYEHNRYLIESERTNQVQIHENGLTRREVLIDTLVSDALREPMPKLSQDGIPVVEIPAATPIPPGMVVIYVLPATATAMAGN